MNSENTAISPDILAQTKTMKVLVVDDSRTLRRLLIRELNTVGITNIAEAADGVEALEKASADAFDLMLLDMEMPEMDGLETLKAVKASETLRHLPVIVVSGSEHFERTIECIQVGAEDYLPKPFNPVLLRARVFSSLEKKRLRDLDKERILQLQREKELLNVEQMKTEKLLLNILPKPIAERLKKGESNISGNYPEVTILFSDLVGFTKMSSQKTAA
ncbi:MAG: response regulator, partial [Alcaligenaceae bacterium]